jgi:ribosomal protein S18 acetylase RimI-like enzyme
METIRPYASQDRDACLRILAGNTPEFFAEAERAEFERFLDDPPGPYAVVEKDGNVIACGGWYISDDGLTARMTWGMVDPRFHGRGHGRQLLSFRVAAAKQGGARVIRLSTTQLVSRFFERQGFETVAVHPDGFGDGLDRLDMELRVASAV